LPTDFQALSFTSPRAAFSKEISLYCKQHNNKNEKCPRQFELTQAFS
jgi:hypothetical protein